MNTLTFLNSPLLWGLALASIPILIHLLYRRQYRRVEWAPMRYLKLSMQRNRRRIRIEQILLLLLRTALVLLLFFLVARPVMHAEGLSRFLGSTNRTNRIAVLDDSLSMGYTVDGRSAFARGQNLLADLLTTFGAKDAFTLVTASAPRQPLLREVELENIDDLVQTIRQVQCSEMFVAWEPAFQAVDELVASGSYPLHEVTLVTDLRRAGWEETLAELGSRWAGSRVRLRVFDVGSGETANVALVALEQLDRLALAGVPTRFEAHLRNDTTGELAGLEANLIVDGKASLVRVPPLPPGEVVRVPLVAALQEAGQHDVALHLPDDALPGDNRRTTVLDVRQSVSMLLVDGEPSTEPLGGEADFLALALSLSGDSADAFAVEVINDATWASSPATDPDLLVLANVAQLTPEQAERIERQVKAGMGLMIFVGDVLDPDNYNQLLHRGGSGLLPAAFEGISDTEFAGLLVEPAAGSPLESLAQLTPAALQRIKIRKTYDVKLPAAADNVRVLARWNNAASSPAVIQKVLGEGQVLLWTTAADRSWSDWPTEASYVLAVREAARAIARAGTNLRQYTAGQPLRVEVSATRDITLPAIELPGAKEPTPLVLSSAGTSSPGRAGGPARLLNYTDTRAAGLYKITWRDSAQGAQSESFAVNADARESALARWSPDEFRGLWGALEPEVVTIGAGEDASLAVRGQEIWRTLATCLFGLLVVEACFARWAGRQH